MKDREYFLQMISDRMDRELTPPEEIELAEAMTRDDTLAEYQQSLLMQQSALRGLPVLTPPLPESSFTIPLQKPSLLRRAWGAQVRIPLPLAASLALCLIGWVWLASNDVPEPSEATVSSTLIKYVQIERLEPAIAIPASYQIESSSTTVKEGEM